MLRLPRFLLVYANRLYAFLHILLSPYNRDRKPLGAFRSFDSVPIDEPASLELRRVQKYKSVGMKKPVKKTEVWKVFGLMYSHSHALVCSKMPASSVSIRYVSDYT